ncbi:MAG: ribosome recycling factor [Ferruginibacter sp.]
MQPINTNHICQQINKIISDIGASMQKALNHLEAELVKIRAGKANPNMLDGIMADYYGNPTPINQVANISILDARTISVQPCEKTCRRLLKEI